MKIGPSKIETCEEGKQNRTEEGSRHFQHLLVGVAAVHHVMQTASMQPSVYFNLFSKDSLFMEIEDSACATLQDDERITANFRSLSLSLQLWKGFRREMSFLQ